MKSAVFQAPVVFALLFGTAAVPGCASKSNPILPSTGGSNPRGLVEGEGSDGGASGDTLKADVAEADLLSNADSGICDLLTQMGCPSSLACFPVSGTAKCQDYGPNSENTPCSPLLGIPGQCIPGLACVATVALGLVCEPFCDVHNPAIACGKGAASLCTPLWAGSTVGTCQP